MAAEAVAVAAIAAQTVVSVVAESVVSVANAEAESVAVVAVAVAVEVTVGRLSVAGRLLAATAVMVVAETVVPVVPTEAMSEAAVAAISMAIVVVMASLLVAFDRSIEVGEDLDLVGASDGNAASHKGSLEHFCLLFLIIKRWSSFRF